MPHLAMTGPVALLTLFEEQGALVAVEWGRAPDGDPTDFLAEAKRQLDAYFDGRLRAFDLPLAPPGTDFQEAVWLHLCAIPYGRVQAYGDLAAAVGGHSRAGAGACRRNPMPIVIPCHGVVPRGARLGGYSGGDGVDTKRDLLRLERFDDP